MTRRRKAADEAARAGARHPRATPRGPVQVDLATLMPGLRARHDGWTQARVQRFLDTLAHTGCVEDAARVAGMSDVGARRLKARFPRFAAAWDDALGRAQKGLIAIAYKRAVEGRETIIIRKGEEVERRIAPSDAMLGLLVKRGDLVAGGLNSAARDDVLTLAEWRDHWRFDDRGQKYRGRDPRAAQASFIRKIEEMRERLHAYALEGGYCPRCTQPLPQQPDGRSMAELVAAGVVDMAELTDGD